MHDTILVRYAEIGIKGNNRGMFENKLVENIKACLQSQGIGKTAIERRFGRIMLHTSASPDLSKVFGIASYSTAIATGTSLEALQKAVELHLTGFKTFRVTCSRLDKTFPLDSRAVAKELGSFIVKKTGAKVSLETFDREFIVEILHGKLYFITNTVAGPGGLPVGIEGNVVAYIDSENAEKAALLLMKRGCAVIALLPHKRALHLLQSYAYGLHLQIIESSDIEGTARKENAKAVIVGDTLHNLHTYDTTLPVMRPLVGGAA